MSLHRPTNKVTIFEITGCIVVNVKRFGNYSKISILIVFIVKVKDKQ